ncbi:hypothetical protein HAX54_040807 [Datura stramonium]|uniref:Uncharacterized protein n=1 Tax=Datura stramonium TaxID=4076 RepID=A0ABS8VPR6_DATST|nr:hypothetical protein [Datura stramonium]
MPLIEHDRTSSSIDVRESEPPHVEVPPSTEVVHLEDQYRVAPIYSYHEVMTLLDRWIVTMPGEPLALPPNLLMPSMKDIASRAIDGLVLHFN